MITPPAILGWDIGGVNTKVARLRLPPDAAALQTNCLPYEIKNRPEALAATLIDAAASVGSQPEDLHAVTMTAELSQAFRTKGEGVAFVLDSIGNAFPGRTIYVYSVDGFVPPGQARQAPLSVGAANWAATASLVARSTGTCVLIDIGTTSADLIPVVNGKIVALGRTDPERLLSGELVYTGALRTPVEAMSRHVPLWGGSAAIAADGFAISGDVHLWLGDLPASDYTCAPPDGHPPTRQSAGERLARVVCADREMLDDAAIDDIARALAADQVQSVARALERILVRWPVISTAVVTGLGDFVAAASAAAVGLDVVPLSQQLGLASRTAPAAAVALLLWHNLEMSG
jgi:(4-(4-[2-(gamma-L-glutamylamino)ethyl]phenoxymethyl)furan-2-yl)methanamine synthase